MTESQRSTIIIAGGAGYIASHLVLALTKHTDFKSYNLVVMDNLLSGHKQAIPKGVTLENADIKNEEQINTVFSKYKDIKAVFVSTPNWAHLVSP